MKFYLFFVMTIFSLFPGISFALPSEKAAEKLLNQLIEVNKGKKCQVSSDMEYVCDSMSEFACKDGTYKDGTGKVLSKNDYEELKAPLIKKVKKLYDHAILKTLKNSDPKYDLIRDLAIKATLQENTPGCASDQKSKRNECFDRVSSILSQKQALLEVGGGGVVNPMGGMNPPQADVDMASLVSLMTNQAYLNSVKSAHDQSIKLASDERLSRKIEKDVFPKVKEIMIQKVTASIKDPGVRDKVIKKIQNIVYDGNDCSVMGGYGGSQSSVAGMLIENAFYNPQNQTFRFCNGFLLKNNSEFSIAMVIAHELSHSIDPCNIQFPPGNSPITYDKVDKTSKDLESIFPFDGLIACLRSEESVGAISQDEDRINQKYNSPFCNRDQIGESFSDWMGAEVLADYTEKHNSNLKPEQKLIGYSNVFRNLCGPSYGGFDVHPKAESRIDRIILANPKIREQIGCGSPKDNLHHCKTGENFVGTRAKWKEQDPNDQVFMENNQGDEHSHEHQHGSGE